MGNARAGAATLGDAMRDTLSGCKVAILAINGFNCRRFFEARARLLGAGAITSVVSPTRDGLIRSWHPSNTGLYTAVDRHVDALHPAYNALFLPGTVIDPEAVFVDLQAADFVKSFFDLGRPIASLCRDRWLFVHRDNILSGHLKPDSPILSGAALPQSFLASSAGLNEPYEELDFVIKKMLAFFQASLVCKYRSMTPSAKPGPNVGATV